MGEAAVRVSQRYIQLKPGTFEHVLPVPGRVAITIYFKEPGRKPAHLPFIFGSEAALLTGAALGQAPSPDAAIRCFREVAVKKCDLHFLTWTKDPNSITAMVSILNAGKTDGSDVAVCAVGPDGALVNCTVTSRRPAP